MHSLRGTAATNPGSDAPAPAFRAALPGGGLMRGRRLLPWRWELGERLRSRGIRYERETWYLFRVQPESGGQPSELVAECFDARGVYLRKRVELAPPGEMWHRLSACAGSGDWLGWLHTPKTHGKLRLELHDATAAPRSVVLHPVEERDPKCHPLSNTPRWSAHRPPFPIEHVFLPRELAALAEQIDLPATILDAPTSLKRLANQVQGAACVLAPQWVAHAGWSLTQVEQLASLSWLIVDLETVARLVTDSGRAETRVETYRSQHGLMSARVEYSDVETRGFALQDVFPHAYCDERGRFCTRVLRRTRSWKRFADQTGFATLLASETPWADRTGDTLTAASAVGSGELIASDVPWLAAGRFGPLAAPRLMRHLLGTHLARPVADELQYWNRWDDEAVVLRDLADFEKRYPELRPVRWAAAEAGLASIGLELAPGGTEIRRRLLIRTGRIDQRDAHDGLPPEPLAIFIKWLAREARERTQWAQRHLAHTSVCWQFDCAAGLRYALQYWAAGAPALETRVLRLRAGRPSDVGAARSRSADGAATEMRLDVSAGVFGDRSFDIQRELTRELVAWIERHTDPSSV